MRRLLITGTSHVAAIRLAWESHFDRPKGLEVDYLAANVAEFRSFAMNDSGLFGLHDENLAPVIQRELARSFSGTLVRSIADYTHVVMVGCTLNNYHLLRLLSAYRVDRIRETTAELPRLSQAAYTAFSMAIAWEQYPVAALSRMTPLAKVALMSNPRLSEAILTDPTAEGLFKVLAADPVGIGAALGLTDAAFKLASKAQGVTYFAPPADSLTPSGFTKYEHARNSVHIRQGRPEDHAHMNGLYGAACGQQILDWVLG